MSQDVGSLRCFTHQSSRSYNRSSQRTDIYSGEPIGPPIRSCTTPSLSEYPSSGQSGIEHGFGKDLSRSSTVPIQPLMPTTETADSYFGEYSPGLGVYDNSTSSYNSPDVSYPSSMYTKATGSLSNLSIQSNQYLDSDWDHYKQQQMQGYKSSHFDAPSQPSERPPEPYMAGYNTGLEARPDNGVPKLGSITPTFLAARNSDSSYSQSRRQPAGPKETMQDPLRDDRFHRNYQGSSSAARSCAPALSIHIPPAIIVPSDGTSGSTGIRSVRSAPPSPIPHRGRLRKHQSQESRSNGKNLAVPTAEDLDHRNVRPRANSRVLTEEGRRHANEVRKIGACKACQQKKVKVGLWTPSHIILSLTRSSAHID